jgi:putative DNA primase/helicase
VINWDKVHHADGRTYGEATIEESIRKTPSTIGEYQTDQYEVFIGNSTEDVFEEKEPNFMLSELGNAERMIHHHGKNIKF